MRDLMMQLANPAKQAEAARRKAIVDAAQGRSSRPRPPSPSEQQVTEDAFRQQVRRAQDTLASSQGAYRRST